MNKILIGTPKIASNNRLVRLEADVELRLDGETDKKRFFYEVEKQWAQYLTAELSDPFILAFVELAMERSADVVYEAPMTEDLRYQLDRYLIPVFAKKIKTMHPVKLIGPTTKQKVETCGVTGTGFSGGVDSFYSVLSHLEGIPESKRVTHVMLAVNGAAATGVSEERDQKWFKEETDRLSPAVKELGLAFVGVNSNVSLINNFKKCFGGGSAIPTSSFVHALRKLFGTYYWASAYEADVLEFRDDDGGYIEPFVVPLLSVDGLRFYHSGCEVSRIEKEEFIADNPVARKTLTVCGGVTNCGACSKCVRTMAELNSIGKLDKFSDVFPNVDRYKKRWKIKLARELGIDHPPFSTDIIVSYRKHGIHIPPWVFIVGKPYFRVYYLLKDKLKDNKLCKIIYYKFGLDEKLGEGKHSAEYKRKRISEQYKPYKGLKP